MTEQVKRPRPRPAKSAVDIVREFFPDATVEEADGILWEYTGFPSFWTTGDPVAEMRAQLARLAETRGRPRPAVVVEPDPLRPKPLSEPQAARLEQRIEAARRKGDPYIQEADANPERRGNGCMIYREGQ